MRDEDPVAELRSLERDIDPPHALEARIVDRLRRDGSIRRKPAWPAVVAAAAALALAFGAGWIAGRDRRALSPAGDRYLLLLYGDVTAPETDLVQEYGAWARQARAEGRQISGERLGSATPLPPPSGAAESGDDLRGFFVFSATSEADAAAVAQSHPHLRRGGKVVLHRILPT
jgi:hypothetical protein